MNINLLAFVGGAAVTCLFLTVAYRRWIWPDCGASEAEMDGHGRARTGMDCARCARRCAAPVGEEDGRGFHLAGGFPWQCPQCGARFRDPEALGNPYCCPQEGCVLVYVPEAFHYRRVVEAMLDEKLAQRWQTAEEERSLADFRAALEQRWEYARPAGRFWPTNHTNCTNGQSAMGRRGR